MSVRRSCAVSARPTGVPRIRLSVPGHQALHVASDGGRRLRHPVDAAGEPGPRAVHAVRHTLYPSARLPAWPDPGRGTTLVFIVRDLEERDIAGILEKILTPATP